MKKKLNLLLTFSLVLVCCIFGQLFLMLSNNNVAHAETSEIYKVGNGASVRIGEIDGETVKGYGIKFKATVPDNTKSYNMAIMPIDYYNYYQRLDDAVKAQYDYNIIETIPAVAGRPLAIVENCPYVDEHTIHGSIVNIMPSNLEREFIAIVYYIDGNGDYHFAQNADDCFRSIASVASRAINSQEYADTTNPDNVEVLNALKGFLSEEDLIEVALPFYGESNSNFFAYGSIGSSQYTIDLENYSTGNTPLTLDRLLEYKAAGFNVLYSGLTYDGGNWETSTMKKGMDLAYEAGLKVVVTDYRVLNVITINTTVDWTLEGDQCFYNGDGDITSRSIENYMAACVKDYAAHPAFYGINMFDEPNYTYAEKYGKTYMALKKVIAEGDFNVENPYLHCNLLPNYADTAAFPNRDFKAYLEAFIDATKDENGNIMMDRLSIDVYPYRDRTGLIGSYYSGMQVFAETCKAKGVEATIVLQSYSGYDPTTDVTGIKVVTVNDMYQQMNTALAMGITDFSFYTYYARNSMSSKDGGYSDIGGFLTVKGNKTNIYYYAQQAMKEANAVTAIFNNYDYLGGNYFKKSGYTIPSKYNLSNTSYSMVGSINTVSVSNNFAYVSEFKDSINSLYGYAVLNPYDEFSMTSSNNYDTTVTLTFDSGYDYVAEIYAGNVSYHKLTSNTFTKTLSVGDATYLIPLKSSVNTGLSSIYGKAKIVLTDSQVYYQPEMSIDLYDLIAEEPNVTYSFAVNGSAVSGRTYYPAAADNYNVTVTAKYGSSTATANTSFTVNESKTPYHDRFDIIVAPTNISWFAMHWAEYYTVSVDGGNEINVGNALTFDYAANGVAAGNHTISLKGYLEDGSYKETVKDVIYSPDGVKLVNADKIDDGYLNTTSGSITYTSTATSNRSASFITIGSDFTDEFIKVRFTALGVNFDDTGLNIGLRDAGTTTDVLSGWSIAGHWAHGAMINYGQNAFMNRFNGYGIYDDLPNTSHTTFKFNSSFVVGKEYSLMTGVVGTGEDKVIHVILLDENDNVLRYTTSSWAQMTEYATAQGKTLTTLADSGAFTIYNTIPTKNSFSYEIIPYEKLNDVLNIGVENFAYANKQFTWNATAGVAGYMIKVDDGEWIDVGNVTSYSIADLDLKGECVAKIRAYDVTGYCYKITTVTFRMWLDVPVGDGDATTGDVYD